ncbi:MAG: M48 family metalloprotease, partial [Chloroflexota bacterium]
AVAASALGSVSAGRVGVREVATGALAVLCLTPVVGVLAVRGRYGAPGDRTFRQQIAANRASSVLLVAVLFEVVGVTAFLIGAGVGVGFGAALAGGLVLGGLSLAVTVGATAFALLRGDTLVLDLARARPAGAADRRLVNVVAELSTAAGIPAPAVFVIDVPAANALSIGRDPAHASIAITRGLLERLDREELQGVVAHELAHVANLDSRHALLVALLVGAVVLLTDVFLQVAIEVATHPWVGGDSLSEIVGSLAAWLVVAIVGLALAGVLRLFAPWPRSPSRPP